MFAKEGGNGVYIESSNKIKNKRLKHQTIHKFNIMEARNKQTMSIGRK